MWHNYWDFCKYLISHLTNGIDHVIESYKGIFSPFAWLVASFGHLSLKFMMKTIFEKKKFLGSTYILVQEIWEIYHVHASDFGRMS